MEVPAAADAPEARVFVLTTRDGFLSLIICNNCCLHPLIDANTRAVFVVMSMHVGDTIFYNPEVICGAAHWLSK